MYNTIIFYFKQREELYDWNNLIKDREPSPPTCHSMNKFIKRMKTVCKQLNSNRK